MLPDEFYQIAMMIYFQGMECDTAASLLRKKLPYFIEEIVKEVKYTRGDDYMKEKEKPIIVSY